MTPADQEDVAVELEPVALESATRRERRRACPPGPQPDGTVARRRHLRRLGALVAAVVVMVAAVGRLTGAGPAGVLLPEEAEVPVSTEIGLSPAPPSALKPLAEGWRLVRRAPIASRHGAVSTWTGKQLLIWGGTGGGRPLADGAAYSPDTDQWRLLPPAPLPGQEGLASAWTGVEWIIWAGDFQGDGTGQGAAYNPGTGTWRILPPAPIRSTGAQAVWTGREMLLWGGSGGTTGAAYDPEHDRWRRLARGGPEDVAGTAVWTGREMLVWGFMASAAYDPAADRWRRLPLPPVTPWITRSVVWTGNELLAVGGFTEAGPAADAAAYDPAANRWRLLASGPDPIDVSDATATWTGELLVMARGPSRLQIYDPFRDVWSETPGLLDGPRVGSVAVWTGEEMVFWGGYGNLGTAAALEEGVAWRP